MNKLYKKSLNGKITFAYGTVFFLLFTVLSLVYYGTSYNMFLTTHKNNSRQLSKIVSSQIDSTIDAANSIEVHILESDDILNYIFNEASLHDVRKDWEFRNNLYSITGYNYNFYHLNIVNLSDNTVLTFGEEYNYRPLELDEKTLDEIVKPAMDSSGRLNIFPPEKGCLYTPRDGVSVYTLTRSFGRYPLTTRNALIEIQLSVSSLSSLIDNLLLGYDNGGESVLIFDQELSPVYTGELSDQQVQYYLDIFSRQGKEKSSSFMKNRELLSTYTSSDTNLTVMLITPEAYLLQNRLFYMGICLVFFLCSFVIMVFITRQLSRRIAAPITELSRHLSTLELSELDSSAPIPSESAYFNEMELLSQSYSKMQLRLKNSLEETVHSRTLTIHAQLMALQAQMDSHFLYNTLTIISIIAENNNDDQASDMCIKLTRMLRYITEDITQKTTFSQELAHTHNYTDLLKVRFQENIQFTYNTSEAVDSLFVPRLIVQPLVENSVKYSRKPDRILKITIHSWRENDYWYAQVTDNGDGFSEEVLQTIWARIDTLNSQTGNPILNINGMGIANIYLRLKFYYNDDFVFQITNVEEDGQVAGSSITIGGKIYEL